jgi:ubiquinone/menaquinone biosynthesis C-methylase UbiE
MLCGYLSHCVRTMQLRESWKHVEHIGIVFTSTSWDGVYWGYGCRTPRRSICTRVVRQSSDGKHDVRRTSINDILLAITSAAYTIKPFSMMTGTSKQTLLDRVFAAGTTEESSKLYDEWAQTYDSDMAEHAFTAPTLVAEAIARGLKLNHLPNKTEALKNTAIVDAGCGTGLVGTELAKLGAEQIDGLDISQGMLDVAGKTGAYKSLRIVDLTTRLPIVDGKYDALTCCGTFTHGHLGPAPLAEFVRVIKTSGIVVATVLDSHWEEKGFEAEIQRLEREGIAEVVENESHAYRKDAGGGRVLILRKTSGAASER